jgi:hypothetical protein
LAGASPRQSAEIEGAPPHNGDEQPADTPADTCRRHQHPEGSTP